MKHSYPKFDEVSSLLKSGWEIFTRRGSAPYSPLYYHIYFGDNSKRVHPNTIKKLIKDGVINGTDAQHDKYKLKG